MTRSQVMRFVSASRMTEVFNRAHGKTGDVADAMYDVLDYVANCLSSPARRQQARPVQILSAVAARYGVPAHVLCGRRVDRLASEPRHLACYLMRCDGCSFPEIARAVGRTDHTSAIYACQRVERWADQRRTEMLARLAAELGINLAGDHGPEVVENAA